MYLMYAGDELPEGGYLGGELCPGQRQQAHGLSEGVQRHSQVDHAPHRTGYAHNNIVHNTCVLACTASTFMKFYMYMY